MYINHVRRLPRSPLTCAHSPIHSCRRSELPSVMFARRSTSSSLVFTSCSPIESNSLSMIIYCTSRRHDNPRAPSGRVGLLETLPGRFTECFQEESVAKPFPEKTVYLCRRCLNVVADQACSGRSQKASEDSTPAEAVSENGRGSEVFKGSVLQDRSDFSLPA